MRRAINGKRDKTLLHFLNESHNETPSETPVISPIVDEPESDTLVEDAPLEQLTPPGAGKAGFRVILYNDEHHGQDEVAGQIQKATQYAPPKCWTIMMEAHAKGRAICFNGTREKCHDVTKVLREIRLQCEVDCDD